MRFLQLFAYSLLLGSPIGCYYAANRWSVPRRWHVVAFCAAGGAVGAMLLIATLLVTELSSFDDVRRAALPLIGRYALVGLGLGLVAVVTPDSVRHWLVTLAEQTWRYRWLVLLATFVLLLIQAAGVWLRARLFPPPSVYVHADAPRNATRTMRLPDESQVVLAPGSHLSYTSWFSPHDERELTLTGEATFAVARAAHTALTLETRGVEVSASTARFTVRAYDGEAVARVIVHEGLVTLRTRTDKGYGKVLTLNAGEAVRVGPDLEVVRDDSTFSLHR